jgi:hypothetical protein
MTTPPWVVEVKELVHHPKVKDWCGLPYPGHPKGCPNFDKPGKAKCPYNTPYITEILDLTQPCYLVFSEFDLAGHVEKMRTKHPHWSERQLRNVLYWQSRSRKQMKERSIEFAKRIKANKIIAMGESYGVHLYATAFKSELKLDSIRHMKTCRHIAIVGWRI